MSDIQFNNDQQNEFGRPPQAAPSSDFTGKLIAWGLASSRQQAEYLMIGFAIAILVISFFVYRWGTASPAPAPAPLPVDPNSVIQ